MEREAERQKLLNELKSNIAKKESTSPVVGYELARIIFHELAAASNLEVPSLPEPKTEVQREAQALSQEVLKRIQGFCNTKEEQYFLLVQLFEWLSGLVTGQFKMAFSAWESAHFKN